MAEIIWTEPALDDLNAIAEFIALDNPDAASRLVQRVFSRVESLTNHPELGPGIPELCPQSRYRPVVEPPCRIFYRYDKRTKKLFILGVMRGKKLFQQRLLQRRSRGAKE